jgi:hypothetical protein
MPGTSRPSKGLFGLGHIVMVSLEPYGTAVSLVKGCEFGPVHQSASVLLGRVQEGSIRANRTVKNISLVDKAPPTIL